MKRIFMLISCSLLLGSTMLGCVNRVGDFTVLSTKNIPYDFKVLGQGEGEDVQRIIVIIPTKMMPNLKEAVDQAIEGRNGDSLINAKIYYRSWYIPYIYGECGFTVKGDIVSSKETAKLARKD